MQRIYLDNAATTPLAPAAMEAMQRWNAEVFGNPSSIHHFGQVARAQVEECRDVLAQFLHVSANRLFFTSGATEGNNWILKSLALGWQNEQKHVLISAIEHPSVYQTAQFLKQQGLDVEFVQPDEQGQITVNQIEKHCKPNTAFVSVMFVNNETGIINPITEIGQFCQERQIQFHCDAVQALGKVPFDLSTMPVDFMTFSAHKIHGPKGIGAVYIKEPARLEPFLHGGAQEAGRRAGTENTSGIAGFAATLKWIQTQHSALQTVKALQLRLEQGIQSIKKDVQIIGAQAPRSAFISQIAFPGVNAQNLVMRLDLMGVAASVGSACSSGTVQPSRVLQQMNLDQEVVNSAIRFSFSYFTKIQEIDKTLKILQKLLT